jgi:hypothetical protein
MKEFNKEFKPRFEPLAQKIRGKFEIGGNIFEFRRKMNKLYIENYKEEYDINEGLIFTQPLDVVASHFSKILNIKIDYNDNRYLYIGKLQNIIELEYILNKTNILG